VEFAEEVGFGDYLAAAGFIIASKTSQKEMVAGIEAADEVHHATAKATLTIEKHGTFGHEYILATGRGTE
jgi:hypothetical protein